MISLICPKCNESLTAKEGRDYMFCEYCGYKISLTDKKEFTYTYHEVNDAKIKKQEVRENIELTKLSNERSFVKWYFLLLIFLFLLLIGIGVFYELSGKIAMRKYEQQLSGETITVPFSSSDLTREKYSSACTELKNAGFTNVTAVTMGDLGLFEIGENGDVSQVSIDGLTSFKAGNKFSKDAIVTVRYHSL